MGIYQALMIAEHRKCGGRGWLLYDSAFRQQIVSLETTDFSRLNQSLYLTNFWHLAVGVSSAQDVSWQTTPRRMRPKPKQGSAIGTAEGQGANRKE